MARSLRDLAPDRTALFLDFDGTLVDIAPRPDAVRVRDGTKELLSGLLSATGGACAIVSGRSLSDLEHFLPFYDGVLVGSHGAEQRMGGEPSASGPVATEDFDAVRAELADWAARREGILLEEKPASLVLHYRDAPEREPECAKVLDAVLHRLPGFVVRPSKMALELMPETVTKHAAVRELLKTWSDRIPVAIGDDLTDEGMFAAAQGHDGYGIKVGDGESDADWRLDDVAAVHAALRRWIDGEAMS